MSLRGAAVNRQGLGRDVLRTTPRLSSASRIHSDSFRIDDIRRSTGAHSTNIFVNNHFSGYPYHWSYPHRWYHGYPYHSWLSVGLGYSYGYPYGYISVGYPLFGYYYAYPYPYLSWYNDYNCDFYDGYYVRFGYYRTSYCVVCSGFGCHGYHRHHRHYSTCGVHGYHYYHLRDCSLCYPQGSSYAYYDVDVPDAIVDSASTETAIAEDASAVPLRSSSPGVEDAAEALSAPTSTTPAVGSSTTPSGGQATPEVRAEILDRDQAFFASLRPAQLSFAMGLIQLRTGNYDEACESFFNGSIEDPESPLVKLFLGLSLVAVGEHHFAAEYLRLSLVQWPEFPSYSWSVKDLYGDPNDLGARLTALEESVRLNPADVDSLLALAFLRFHSGATGTAVEDFDALRALSSDPDDQEIATRYVREHEKIEGLAAAGDDVGEDAAMGADEAAAVVAFLSSLSLGEVPALPIR